MGSGVVGDVLVIVGVVVGGVGIIVGYLKWFGAVVIVMSWNCWSCS